MSHSLATSRARKPPGSTKDKRSVSVAWKRHLFSWNRPPKCFSENLILAVERAHLSVHLNFSLACWHPISCSDLFLKKLCPGEIHRESDRRTSAQLSRITEDHASYAEKVQGNENFLLQCYLVIILAKNDKIVHANGDTENLTRSLWFD